jgi:hypothetical protein
MTNQHAVILLALTAVVSVGSRELSVSALAGPAASLLIAQTPPPSGVPSPDPIIEASKSPDAPTRILDPRADQILRSMGRALAAMKTFAFHAEESFDEIPSGQPRVLLTNVRRVAVQRPDRFAADAQGDSLSRAVWYDGKSIVALDKTTNTYAEFKVPDSIDGALDTLSDEYGVDVPLADLLYGDPYAVLSETVTYSRYLGLHTAAGVPCHHLVFAQPTIEWQIWVDTGDQPLPRKLAITYVREPGEPQYVATISAWRLSPTFPETLFRFEAPDGAERVEAQSLVPRTPGASR